MATFSPASIKAMLRAALIASPPGPARANTATSTLTALENLVDMLSLGTWTPVLSLKPDGVRVVWQVVDWTGGTGSKPVLNQYIGTSGYVATAAEAMDVKGLQGTSGAPNTGIARAETLMTDGLAATRYYPICILFQDTGFVRIELTIKPLESGDHAPITVSLYAVARGGFTFEAVQSGPTNLGMGLVGYNSGGNITFAAKVVNTYKIVTARVVDYAGSGTFIYPTLIGQNAAPAGALAYDSTNIGNYRPVRYSNSAVQQLLLGNADSYYPPFTALGGMASLLMGANMLPGNTDIGFMNTNYAAGEAGFTFWQQLSASTKRLLLNLRWDGRASFGAPNLNTERVNIEGRVATSGVLALGTMPSIAKGAACTSAVLETNSNDFAGVITITTTSGHTAGAPICTITFTTVLARAPKVQLTPMTAGAANNLTRFYVATGTSSFTIMNTTTALDNSGTYQFAYLVII